MKEELLVRHGYLLYDENNSDENYAYLATKLLNKFGVIVDNPKYLSNKNLKIISNFYGEEIPDSFYKNPQDLKYFTCDELVIEQFISYLLISFYGENSTDSSIFERKEIFKKILPDYKDGDELKIRHYKMVTDSQADNIFRELVVNYSKYTRKWSADELEEFKVLYLNGYYKNEYIQCKDNAITMLIETLNIAFAKILDKKDIVKMSIQLYGEDYRIDIPYKDKLLFLVALANANDCPLSLKQAKYYNTIVKKVGGNFALETNEKSPYKIVKNLIKSGEVLSAAKFLSENGSLLERNLTWLISRATEDEIDSIIELVKDDNPIVLIQLLKVINQNNDNERIFKFYVFGRLHFHIETEEESRYRKTKLSDEIKKKLNTKIFEKIKSYYSRQKSLGKIYINEEFKKVGIPINTSAMGMGIDVLPPESRLKIKGEYIRTFCYWKDAFDIDTSVIFIKDKDEIEIMNWGNFSEKKFGNSALCSGDCRNANGSEFSDFDIKELKEKGYKYAVYMLNGYGSTFEDGEIYCGYQNKNNLETKAWAPNNIELKINVKGDSRVFYGFAIDFEKMEIIILNQVLNSNSRVVSYGDINAIRDLLFVNSLEKINMYDIISIRGEVVSSPEEADVVFDSEYIGAENQEIIKPFDIAKLVSLLK